MSKQIAEQLLMQISDGSFHSGQKLADELKVSRTVIWKAVQELQENFGLDIYAVSGRGYRISEPLELFDQAKLIKNMSDSGVDLDYSLHLHTRLDSTNQFLLDKTSNQSTYQVCLAEKQDKGRGRRGRSWESPFAKNIQLSVSKTIDCPMNNVSGLSIAIAASLADYLYKIGLHKIAIKWPNDLYVDYKKLAGLLLEIRGEAEGPVKVVVGLGLNLDMTGVKPDKIDQPYTDLKTVLPASGLSRNDIASGLVLACINTIQRYEKHGLSDFIDLWKKFDLYQGEAVTLSSASSVETGIYQGIDEQGNLKLMQDNEMHVYHAGEVSLRKMV